MIPTGCSQSNCLRLFLQKLIKINYVACKEIFFSLCNSELFVTYYMKVCVYVLYVKTGGITPGSNQPIYQTDN